MFSIRKIHGADLIALALRLSATPPTATRICLRQMSCWRVSASILISFQLKQPLGEWKTCCTEHPCCQATLDPEQVSQLKHNPDFARPSRLQLMEYNIEANFLEDDPSRPSVTWTLIGAPTSGSLCSFRIRTVVCSFMFPGRLLSGYSRAL